MQFVLETPTPDSSRCRGSTAEIAPEDLARRLNEAMPLYLIVDFRRLATPRPAELEAAEFLFDWLDPAAAELVSPVLLATPEPSVWLPLVRTGWGGLAWSLRLQAIFRNPLTLPKPPAYKDNQGDQQRRDDVDI